MKDTFLNHNFDKILLFVLVVMLMFAVDHVLEHHGGDMQALEWATGAFSTVLGALVMVLTGRVSRADGQTANGLPPTAQPGGIAPSITPQPSTIAEIAK